MAKPKHGVAKRSEKKAKPASKPAKAKPAHKPAAKAARKPAAPPARKAAPKVAKPAAKAAKRPVPAKKKPAASRSAKPTSSAKPVKAPVAKKPVATKALKKAAPAHPVAPAKHHSSHAAAPVDATPARARVRHARPTGGVAARLNVAAADAQTITREDGRYALPSTVNIDLAKGYKPGAKEEYMNPKQLAYFRQKLKDWRDQLVEESRQTMENLREEVRDVGDDAERATRETENSLELRTRDRYRKLISKIEKALRKIEEGRYGYCEETDEEIGLERLEARPIATLSLDAQERREHLQKQMGD